MHFSKPMRRVTLSLAFALLCPILTTLLSAQEDDPNESNTVYYQRRDAALAAVSRPAPPYSTRNFYINNETGSDSADGLTPTTAVRTFAKAVTLLTAPGDTLHLAVTSQPYRETLLFKDNFGGVPGCPITIEGHGATITGADPINPADWTSLGGGLYKNATLINELEEVDEPSKLQRVFFLFDGVLQNMGRTSKGAHPAFKAPAELNAGEWTYVDMEKAFYVKVDGDLAAANIEAPFRRNGVAIRANNAAATDIVIKDLITCHVLNDGFNFHGTTKNLFLKNIAAYECGDDGISPHETCEMDVDGLWSIGNSTGLADGYVSVATFRNIHLEGNFACQIMNMHSSVTTIVNARVRTQNSIAISQLNPTAGEPLQLILDNVQLSTAKGRLAQNPATGIIDATRITSVGPKWDNKGVMRLSNSVIGNASDSAPNTGSWSGTANVFDIVTTPPNGLVNTVSADVAADALTTRSQPFLGAGAAPQEFHIPSRPVPHPAAGKFTTLPLLAPAEIPGWAIGDNLASYRFTGLTNNAALTAAPVVNVAAGMTATDLTPGTGVAAFVVYNSGNPTPGIRSPCTGTGINRTTEADALANNEYLAFTIAPQAGRVLRPDVLMFDIQASTLITAGTNTIDFSVAPYCSAGGFASSAARLPGGVYTASVTNTATANTRGGWMTITVNLSSLPAITETDSPLEIRLYLWQNGVPAGTSASQWFLEIDNIIVRGAVTNSSQPGEPPAVFIAPASQTTSAGNNIIFTATGSSATPLTWQWFFSGTAIPGATTSTLSLDNVQLHNAGEYKVTGSSSTASADATATLSVTADNDIDPANTLASFRFNNLANNTPLPALPDATAPGLTVSGLAQGTGLSCVVKTDTGVAAPAIQENSTLSSHLTGAAALSGNRWLAFSLTPPANHILRPAEITFDMRTRAIASGTGFAVNAGVALHDTSSGLSAPGGVAGAIANKIGDWQTITVPLDNLSVAQAGETLEFRIYVSWASSSQIVPENCIFECDNIVLTGAVEPLPPPITSIATTTFTNGLPCEFAIKSAPGATITVSGLPAWVTFDAATGIISGTPPASSAQTHTVTINAYFAGSGTTTQTFTINTEPAPTANVTASGQWTFVTLAGTGVAGGANGPAATAQFHAPAGLAFDAVGNIFIADTANDAIRKLGIDDNVTTEASSLFTPTGIAIDASGNIYIADTDSHVIRKIDHQIRAISILAGSAGNLGSEDGTGGGARFHSPRGLAIRANSSGSLYVADTGNHTIRAINLTNGAVTTIAGTAGVSGDLDGVGSAAQFSSPSALAVSDDGEQIYIADTANNTIRKIAAATRDVSTLAGYPGARGAADGAGNAARFTTPAAIAWRSGKLLIIDTGNHTLREITISGANAVVSTYAGLAGDAGKVDGLATVARFRAPAGLATDTDGTFVVADTGNNVIRMAVLPPALIATPVSKTVVEGSSVSFAASATGAPIPTCQWYFSGTLIPSATAATLSLQNLRASDSGTYKIIATNPAGSVEAAATLTVTASSSNPGDNNNNGGGGGGGGAPGLFFWISVPLLLAFRCCMKLRKTFLH